MANELQFAATIKYAKGSVSFTRGYSDKVDVAGAPVAHDVQNIDTVAEQLSTGEVALTGYGVFSNVDATHYIEIGDATNSYHVKLKPGEFSIFRLDNWAAI